MVLWLLWSLTGEKNHLSKRWGMASFTFQQLEFFCIRTWQWVMFILQTAVIARMSPAPTFGQVASRLRPADSQLCYQRQAKAQHCCKTPCHQKLIQQSSLTVVKNIPSQSAGKATKECTADNLPGSAGSLALKAGRGMASQAHWLLFPVLPPQQLYFAHLHQFFTVLTVLCYIIFYVFCHWYTRRIISIKRKGKATAIFWVFFEHILLRSVNSFLQLLCYCNFSSLPPPSMQILYCCSAFVVMASNCA